MAARGVADVVQRAGERGRAYSPAGAEAGRVHGHLPADVHGHHLLRLQHLRVDSLRHARLDPHRLPDVPGTCLLAAIVCFDIVLCTCSIMASVLITNETVCSHNVSTFCQALHDSCEPELFSMDRLIVNLVTSDKTTSEALKAALLTLEDIV